MIVYPKSWLSIWKALVAEVPFDMFQPRVQVEIEAMTEAGLLKIDLGYVQRIVQPRNSDFVKQLAMVE